MAVKQGKRVHTVASAYVSQRCPSCGYITPRTDFAEKKFTCSGCLKERERSEVSARNLAALCCECSGADDNPRRCSHDGKHLSYVEIAAPKQDSQTDAEGANA